MDSLIPKAEFIGIENLAHLAAGGESPVLAGSAAAVNRFLLDKGTGMPGRVRMYDTASRCRKDRVDVVGALGIAC